MSTISYYMKFQSIKLGNNVIKFVKQYYFIDYHSILATFSITLHSMIFKEYWFEFQNRFYIWNYLCVSHQTFYNEMFVRWGTIVSP